ncbi:MAG: Bug family tripartite tricarboxylate transporter substrate binding protein [Burkholderiales bacterium]
MTATYIGLAGLLIVTSPLAWPHSTYPNKPIRWVVPFAPGGGTDMIARPIAQKLSERLGQPILYENRGGGGGLIAGEIVARATPDGYTLLIPTAAVMAVNVSLYPKMPFDPARDFTPITKMANVPNMLAAHPSFPPRSIPELVAYAKTNPRKVNWGSSGNGAGGHLGLEMFRLLAGIQVVHVPYKGAGPANVGLLGGEVDLLFANPSVFLPHIKAGRLRGIGIGSLKRLSSLPDLPTFDESGYPGFEAGSWYGMVAPAGTAPAIIARLHSETVKVLALPEILGQFALEGAQAVGNTPPVFRQEIRDDTVKWSKVIREAEIKL